MHWLRFHDIANSKNDGPTKAQKQKAVREATKRKYDTIVQYFPMTPERIDEAVDVLMKLPKKQTGVRGR